MDVDFFALISMSILLIATAIGYLKWKIGITYRLLPFFTVLVLSVLHGTIRNLTWQQIGVLFMGGLMAIGFLALAMWIHDKLYDKIGNWPFK